MVQLLPIQMRGWGEIKRNMRGENHSKPKSMQNLIYHCLFHCCRQEINYPNMSNKYISFDLYRSLQYCHFWAGFIRSNWCIQQLRFLFLKQNSNLCLKYFLKAQNLYIFQGSRGKTAKLVFKRNILLLDHKKKCQ